MEPNEELVMWARRQDVWSGVVVMLLVGIASKDAQVLNKAVEVANTRMDCLPPKPGEDK